MISLVSEGDTFHSNCVCQTPSGTAWHLLFSRALLLGQCHPSVGTSVEVQKTWKKSFSKCIQLRKCRLSQFSSSSTQFLNGELLPRLLTLIIEAFFLSIDFYHFLSCLHFRFRLFLKISSWRRIVNFSSSKSFLKRQKFWHLVYGSLLSRHSVQKIIISPTLERNQNTFSKLQKVSFGVAKGDR